jgi:transcriptional regulator with XRE-family HTH domain
MGKRPHVTIGGGKQGEDPRRRMNNESRDKARISAMTPAGATFALRFDRKIFCNSLGSVLREERLRAGVSQDELSGLAEIDRTTPSHIERGLGVPSLDMLLRISIAINVDPIYILVKAYKTYCRIAGIPIPKSTSLQLAAYSEIEKAHDLQARVISKPVSLRYAVLPQKLRDPLLAFDILEASLKGESFSQCAKRFGVTLAWCGQLSRKGAAMLISGAYAIERSMPPHDWTRNRDRVAHREFWLELIKKTRKTMADTGGVATHRSGATLKSAKPGMALRPPLPRSR